MSQTSTQTLVGIAFYDQPSRQYPRWALVLHQKQYNSQRVRVYQIRRRDNDDWVLDHKRCHLESLGELIGVLHLTISPYDINVLDEFLQAYPAGKESMNPGQVFAWSPSAWVIRALIDMHEIGFAVIPGRFRHRTFWEEGSELSFVLREEPETEGMRIVSWPTA